MWDSCYGWGSVCGCSWGTVGNTSVACCSEVDSLSGGCGWPCPHTSQLLQIQWCNMCYWSLVDQILFCHNWPWGAPSTAQYQHQGWLKWACIGFQTQWQHHYHHLSVHNRWVGISCLQIHQQICQTSSWHPPVHRDGLMGRSHHLRCFQCNQGISLDLVCGLHLVGPSGP